MMHICQLDGDLKETSEGRYVCSCGKKWKTEERNIVKNEVEHDVEVLVPEDED